MLTIGSLFSGIGGLELGLEAALGARTVWQVEHEEFARRVLADRWPAVDRSVVDVCLASSKNLAPVDVICGGFPCQDLSLAGKQAGLSGSRSRLAWELLRVVTDLGPRAVVVENSGHGWRSWVPQLRRAFWIRGYASVPIRVRASDVGAPHQRSRIFLLAWTDAPHPYRLDLRDRAKWGSWGWEGQLQAEGETLAGHAGTPGAAPHTHDDGRSSAAFSSGSQPAKPQPVGVSWGVPPPSVRRVDDGPRPRLDPPRIRALGNAVVPQCAELAGQMLLHLGVFNAD